jgi:SAM-dependent methyltransferase
MRRALSNVGGRVELAGGTTAQRAALAAGLDIAPDAAELGGDIQGFHSYAARLHPVTARRLIATLCPQPGARILDPFCGSGTVLVEARRLGHHAFGVDANPLAVELSRLKTRGATREQADAIVATARRVAEHAEARRRAKAGATRVYGAEDVALFDAHVLLELDGLRAGIRKHAAGDVEMTLLLVLSAILNKLSRARSDTSDAPTPRRLAGGFAIRFFAKKTEELAELLVKYASALPASAPPAKVRVGDARSLDHVRTGSMQLVLTSPPYPGVYDYQRQHRVRLRWLGLHDREFERSEIGARRNLSHLDFARAMRLWELDLGKSLTEIARVLEPAGLAALVLADSVLIRRRVHADRLVERLAEPNRLRLLARAAQQRPDYFAPRGSDTPRREHVILLGPMPRTRRR